MEQSERRGWAVLALKKAAVFVPYIVKLAYLLGMFGIVMLSVDLYRRSSAELQLLIDSGELPRVVMEYPLALTMMIVAAMLIMWRMRR